MQLLPMKVLACLGGHPIEAVLETCHETLANRQVPTSRLEAVSLGFHGVTKRLLPRHQGNTIELWL